MIKQSDRQSFDSGNFVRKTNWVSKRKSFSKGSSSQKYLEQLSWKTFYERILIGKVSFLILKYLRSAPESYDNTPLLKWATKVQW